MISMKQKTMSNMIWTLLERVLAQVITLTVTIVLARILVPEDYGVVAIISAVIQICNIFVVKGFGNALIQKKDADQVDFSTVFYLNIALTVVVYILLLITAPCLANFYNLPILFPLLATMGLRIPLSAINSVQHAYVSRRLEFRRYFFSTLAGSILSAIVGIGMAYEGLGAWALVSQYLMNSLISTTFLWFTVKWRPILAFSTEKAKDMFSYGWKLLVSSIIDEICKEIKVFAIGKVYSPTDLAYYSKGNQFPNITYTNIDASASSVLFPVMAKAQDNLDTVKRYVRLSISVTSFCMFPILVVLIAAAESFTSVVLTDKWLPIVPYMRILCVSYIFSTLLTANLQAMKAIGRSDAYLKFNVIKNSCTIITLLITVSISVKAVAIGAAIMSALFLIINSFPNKKLLNYGLGEQLMDVYPCMAVSLIMGCIVYSIKYLCVSNLITFCIQIPLGLIIYIGMSKTFKVFGYTYMVNLLKERLHRE